MLGWGQGLVAAGGVLALGATLADLGLWPIVGGIAVYVLGCGFTFPNATAAAMQPHPTIAGVAASLLGFVQMICGALGSLVVMALYDGTALAMTLVMAAGGLASIAVASLRRRVAPAAGE
jgi:DHA1 family bicyclomycin/chloramphenicol resistance-like MFS transporter